MHFTFERGLAKSLGMHLGGVQPFFDCFSGAYGLAEGCGLLLNILDEDDRGEKRRYIESGSRTRRPFIPQNMADGVEKMPEESELSEEHEDEQWVAPTTPWSR